MTILCATRFSEESSHAVTAAAALARAHRERLTLVHVAPGGVLRPFTERFLEAARTALAAEAARLQADGTEVTAELLTGRVEDVLAAYATTCGARLLVVGDTASRGTSFMASTLDKLALSAEVPVLIVRDERPFEAWALDEAPLKVLLALDKTTSSAVARDWVARLAEYGRIDLVATSVVWPMAEYQRRGVGVPPPEEGHVGITHLVREELQQELRALPSRVTSRVRLELGLGHTAEQLVAVANEEQVDVVLLGTHRKRALGRPWSVSHHVMLQAPMNVACVPSTAAVAHVAEPPRWRSLLALNDFSEAASRSVSFAASAVGSTGTVHVVHVSPEPFSPEQEKRLRQRLSDSLPPNSEVHGARVLLYVLHGDPDQVVVDAAKRLDVDGLCIGSIPVPAFEATKVGVVGPAVLRQWQQVQTMLERLQKPVLLVPPLAE